MKITFKGVFIVPDLPVTPTYSQDPLVVVSTNRIYDATCLPRLPSVALSYSRNVLLLKTSITEDAILSRADEKCCCLFNVHVIDKLTTLI